MDNSIFYNYDRVISYNAFLNFLIGERGVGKTFGASEFVTRQFIKKNDEFIYIRRYKTDLEKGKKKFFKGLIDEEKFPNHKLEVKGNTFIIDDKIAGYSMTLSTAHQFKSTNFPKVKYIIFDEFLIENGQSHYLKNEVNIFLGLIETVARMRDVKIFCLANATSEVNPYFLFFDLTLPYNNDIKLYKDGLILLQYMDNKAYREAKKQTKFGRLVEGTDYEDYAINNKFSDENKNFIEHKTGSSKFSFSFIYKGNKYATDGVKVAKYNSAGELELLEDSDPLAAEVLTAFKAVTAEPELGIPSETSEEATGAAVHGMSTTEPPSEEPIVEAGGKLTGFTYLLHTHNTFELGLKVRDNKLEFLDADMKRYEHRIDSAIGLVKVYEADWKDP